MLSNNLSAKRIWKRIYTRLCIAETLCCTPEANLHLILYYTTTILQYKKKERKLRHQWGQKHVTSARAADSPVLSQKQTEHQQLAHWSVWLGSWAPSPHGSSHTWCFLIPPPLLGSLLPSPALLPFPALLLLSQVRGQPPDIPAWLDTPAAPWWSRWWRARGLESGTQVHSQMCLLPYNIIKEPVLSEGELGSLTDIWNSK